MTDTKYEYAIWAKKYGQRYHDWEPTEPRISRELLARVDDLNEDYGPGQFDIVRRPVLEWETLDGNKREETD